MVSQQTLLADSVDLAHDWDAPRGLLTREKLIAGILEINTSVSVEFLNSFDECQLRRYLEHLQMHDGPRGRDTRWCREPQEPAIDSRESLD